MKRKSSAYARAGVDIGFGNILKERLPALVRSTHGPRVLGGIGAFGGLFRAAFPGIKDPVLVASMDGVGTKLNIAVLAGRHGTVGGDLVNHCVNDIAVMGARPLFFLDYLGAGKLDPAVFTAVVAGLARACRRAGCALLGGETAQMPGLYRGKDYDLVGCIVGVVDRAQILDGSRVRAGDKLVALPSNGLHTNGYTLARRVLLGKMKLGVTDLLPGSRRTVAGELLRVHRNYEPALRSLPPRVLHAAAHITGGGLPDNLPRALPRGCRAVIERRALRVPPVFRLIAEKGRISQDEMFRVFNMGVGLVLIVSAENAAAVVRKTGGRVIGEVVKGPRGVQFV
ncbi:MAG: phosphoribosylformylglycinamidine cyclo-ligase [Chthoniobacterales bacterium]|nr:phosphoribosylformylglycinamidine cyclo-ligase [Chthoniobacterales bacterium]